MLGTIAVVAEEQLREVRMSCMTPKSRSIPELVALTHELETVGGRITGSALTQILARSPLRMHDLASFVEPTPHGYSRQRVARTEAFEILLMTWLPGQSTPAHDHAGTVSGYKILGGTALETIYAPAPDGLVDPVNSHEHLEGAVGLDMGDHIHSISNGCPDGKLLVCVHVYAPPMRELRRFTPRPTGRPVAGAFYRRRTPAAPVVAIVGGGFCGAMVAAQLAIRTAQSSRPLHLVIIDRQASIAEGAAYRTSDASHLLNVPASGMSAWPDRPDDFLEWARRRDPAVRPGQFLPRQAYGDYLRDNFFSAVAQTGAQTSIEIRREAVESIERRGTGGWSVRCGDRHTTQADVVVLASGHRPVVDPLKGRWSGPRTRYIEDPWGSSALNSIEPGETVCLLGTGLTAIDTLLTLSRSKRSARILGISRRGLLPGIHTASPLPAMDLERWVDELLQAGQRVTTRAIHRALRRAVLDAASAGRDWRQVIDGLRPHVSRIGTALSPTEMSRFMRHVRPFWEIVRHRMAPSVAERVKEAADTGLFSTSAARILSARGATDRVTLTVRGRGASVPETLRFDWIVNCTGPGSGHGVGLPSVIAGLIKAGHLVEDPLGLGVRSTREGRALTRGGALDDLLIVGSLRKADLWESTAVPELRMQAARAADIVMQQPLSGGESPAPQRVSLTHRFKTRTEQDSATH